MVTRHKAIGFTLIELLVVMAVIATLLTIAFPKYFKSVDYSKEAALKQDLNIMRDALDKYYADQGKFPEALNDLVEKGYLRSIPIDPILDTDKSWVLISPSDTKLTGIANIRSGAEGQSLDGSPYASW